MSTGWGGPAGAPEVGRRIRVPAVRGCTEHRQEVWLDGTVLATQPGYRWAVVGLDDYPGRTAHIRFQEPAAAGPEWSAWLTMHPEHDALDE